MINPQLLELPMSRIKFHGPKDVRVIDVRLYIVGEQEGFTYINVMIVDYNLLIDPRSCSCNLV